MIDDVLDFSGHSLEGMSYNHLLFTDKELPVLVASHVTKSKGTGLVHTAPAHGPEDFQVAVNNKLTLVSVEW